MRYSRSLFPMLKEAPSDASSASLTPLLRVGVTRVGASIALGSTAHHISELVQWGTPTASEAA